MKATSKFVTDICEVYWYGVSKKGLEKKMKVKCIWEHNGDDTLLYEEDCVGAFTRGESLDVALHKMKKEIQSYSAWLGEKMEEDIVPVVVQEKNSDLEIKDADSDVLFLSEEEPLTMEEYVKLRDLALKSASDFLTLYNSIPDKAVGSLQVRKTFYGQVPRTAEEMYLHTKNVNSYYFGEIGVDVDNEGSILECRKQCRSLDSVASVRMYVIAESLWDDIAIDNPAIRLFLKNGFSEEYRTEEIIMLKKEL